MAQALQPHRNTNIPFPTSVLAEKLPKIADDGPSARAGAFSAMQKRAVKRTREPSDDEDDIRPSMVSQEWRTSTRHLPSARTSKRVHISGREWSNILSALRSTSVVEPSSDDEAVSSSQIPIQPPEKQEATQYSQINHMLRSLHLGRAKHKSAPEILREVPVSAQRTDSNGAIQSSSIAPVSTGPAVMLASEQDSVIKLYEEANRALGRLAISRRPYVPRQEVSDESSSEGE